MIAIESTNEHPLASLSRFFSAHGATYRRLLATGDIGDHCRSKKGTGRPSDISAQEIELETQRAIALIAEGRPLGYAASKIGCNANALRQRIYSRGLSVRKIRNQ